MNLDAMATHELASFQRDALSKAFEARGTVDSQTWATLASYAGAKRAAIVVRQAGAIATAAQLEAECDALYERLPESVRW